MKPAVTHQFATKQAARWLAAFLLLATVLLSFLLFRAHGTADMDFYWLKWLELSRTQGPISAYASAHSDYPPLTIATLWLGGKLFAGLTSEPTLLIKLTLQSVLVVSAGIYWWLSRNAILTAIFLTANVIGTMGLAYLDVFSGVWIVAAFLLLIRGCPEGFVVLFACAMLTKWQPLIMAPVVAMYLLQKQNTRQIIALLIWPLALLAIASLFDVQQVLQAWIKLQRAISGSFFNAFALGMQGMLDAAIHTGYAIVSLQYPNDTLALQSYPSIDALTRIGTGTWSFVRFWIFQVLFACFYLCSLVAFAKSKRQINDLLRGSVQLYVVYFIFRHGVHENHLYMPMLLALILAARQPVYLRDAIMLSLLHNLNMIYYYGFEGSWPDGSWLGHHDAQTFLLASLYCIWLSGLWKRWLSLAPDSRLQPAQMNST